MSSRHRTLETTTLAEIPDVHGHGPGQRVLEVDIQYDKDHKGYYMTACVDERAGSVRAIPLGGGASVLFERADRFSAKRLAAITPDPQDVDALKSRAIANWNRMKGLIG